MQSDRSPRTWPLTGLIALVGFIFVPAILTVAGLAESEPNAALDEPEVPDGSAFAEEEPDTGRSIRDLESWVQDRVPGRELAFEFERSTTRIIDDNYNRAVAESPKVIQGADDWLFYADAVNKPCVTADQEARWAAELTALVSIVERSEKEIVVAIAPDRSIAVPELLMDIDNACQRANAEVVDRLSEIPSVIDLDAAVNAEEHILQIDTHWSPAGAMAGMELVVEAIAPGTWEERGLSSQAIDRPGDLDRLVGYDNTESVNLLTIDQPTATAVERFETSLEGRPLMSATTPDAAARNVLFIHDSFGGYIAEEDPTDYLSGLGAFYLRPWFARVDNVRLAGRSSNTIGEPMVAASMAEADTVAYLFVQRTLDVRLEPGFLTVPTAVALADQIGVRYEPSTIAPAAGVVIFDGLGGAAPADFALSPSAGAIRHRVEYVDRVAVYVDAGTVLINSFPAQSTVFVAAEFVAAE